MANIAFGWPIVSDLNDDQTVAFTGSDWRATHPASNAQDPRFHVVARSDDASSTKTMSIDLGAAVNVRVVAAMRPNATVSAQWSIKGGTTPGASDVYLASLLDFWPAGISTDIAGDLSFVTVHVISADKTARYWTVEFSDTVSLDYIDVGRVVLADGLIPVNNMRYGARLGLESDTARTYIDGGGAVYREGTVRRVLSLGFESMDDAWAFGEWMDGVRAAGTSRQVVVAYDPDDAGDDSWRRSFIGTFRDLPAFTQVGPDRSSFDLDIVEAL